METNNKVQTTDNSLQKNISEMVLSKIEAFQETGSIKIPKDYSPANALRAAYLILLETKTMDKKPVLQECSKDSIANALLKMIVQGLNPVKRQCSFIAYGKQLTCQREYQGTIAVAKRDAGVVNVIGNVVYKGDDFSYAIDPETLQKKITKHSQSLETLGVAEITGAYAVVTYKDGSRKVEIMSMAQIRKSWEQGAAKGQSPAHKNFPDQMCIKTVINRALKIDVNSSDDAALFDDDEDVPKQDVKTAHVHQQIEDKGNKKQIGLSITTFFCCNSL